MMVKLSGFAPGSDPTLEGIVLDVSNMLPTMRGSLEAAGIGESVGASPIPAKPYNMSANLLLDNSSRVFAYTDLNIYELSGTAWISRSKPGGYTTGPVNKWRFCQFSNDSIATNYANPVQVSTTSGAFADLAGSPPKAAICETVAGFVMLFDTNDGVNQFRDGWWCSGLYDHTAWTPSAFTQAANGRLFDTPGKITAGKRLGSSVVAYKQKSMYLGQYVGPPVIWQWTQITDDTGAYCQQAVVSTGGVHYFLGENGIFAYDGSRPQPIGAVEVRQWLRDNINVQYADNIKGAYDARRSNVFWFYPSLNSTGDCDEAIVYNTVTGQFGRMTRVVYAVLDYVSPNMTWAQAAALYAAWGGWPNTITWGSPLFYGTAVGLSYVGADFAIYREQSTGGLSSITLGDMGDDTETTLLQGCAVRFLKAPASATLSNAYKWGEGEPLTVDKTVNMSDYRFDVLRTGRFHRLTLGFNGTVEVSAADVQLAGNGRHANSPF